MNFRQADLVRMDRMPLAHHEQKPVIEQPFLHDVAERGRVAQRADLKVHLAASQSRVQVIIGAVQRLDRLGGAMLAQPGDGARQKEGPRQRHRAHHDPPDLTPCEIGLGLGQFGKGQPGRLRQRGL